MLGSWLCSQDTFMEHLPCQQHEYEHPCLPISIKAQYDKARWKQKHSLAFSFVDFLEIQLNFALHLDGNRADSTHTSHTFTWSSQCRSNSLDLQFDSGVIWTGNKSRWDRAVAQYVTTKAKAIVCKTHSPLHQKVSVLMNAACRARTHYSIQSVWSQTVPVGGRRRSPLGIIQLSNMSAPHCDVCGTVLFFLTLAWFLGGSPPSSLRPPSSPPCVFAFLVQFPFLSPGVLTAAYMIIGVHMHVRAPVSFFLESWRSPSAALTAVVWRTGEHPLKERLPQDIQRAFDPTSAIDLVHGRAQTRIWMELLSSWASGLTGLISL